MNNKAFLRNTLTLIGGTAIAQFIVFGMSPILARIYSVENFGDAALFLSISMLISTFVHARYEQAIMLPKINKNSILISLICIFIGLIITFILTLVLVFVNELYFWKKGDALFPTYFYFLPIAGFFVGLFNTLSNLSNKVGEYRLISIGNVIKSISLISFQIPLGVLKLGSLGLVIGSIFSYVIACGYLICKVIYMVKKLDQHLYKKAINLMKKYSDFPKYQIFNAFINTFSASLPIYAFQVFFTATMAGHYSMSIKLILAPLLIISGACSRVFNQKISDLVSKKKNSFKFTIAYLKLLISIMILPTLLFVYFAPEIFSFILGDKWYAAGVYTQILSPWLFMVFISGTITYLPSILNLQKKALLIEIYYTILRVMAIAIGVFFNNAYLALSLFSLIGFIVISYRVIWMLFSLRKINLEIKG